jgi:HK97 family phage portal protein
MKIKEWLKKFSATNRAVTMFFPLKQGVSPRTDYASQANDGYIRNSVVHACIREIASAVAGVPWILYEKQGNGDRKEIVDHPLLALIDRPNPMQGQFEFIESLISHLYLSGNTYIEAVSPLAFSKKNPPRELYVLRPDRIRIIPDPVELVSSYEYKAGGQVVIFPRDQILHIKMFNPLDDYYGLSPVQVAALAINKLNEGDKWNSALLQNAAVPSGALISSQRLGDEQFNRLVSQFQEKYQGAINARKPLLLEDGLDWKELSVTPKEMDWIEGHKFSALQIAQIYNVPSELIGIGNATHQNRREARKALYTEVILPALRRLRDAFNNWLVPRFGNYLELDINTDKVEAMSEDRDSLWERVTKSDFLTVNEKREIIGYGAINGGDVVMISSTLTPLAASAQTPVKKP